MKPMTVTELVQGIRRVVEGVVEWQRLWVVGELSAVKHHSSGHWYFLIKDATAQIRAVMFRRDAAALKGPLKDGMAVLAFGRVGVFERDGQTQFYVSVVAEQGQGQAERELEALKRRLYDEGLFSRAKRSIPLLPRGVGVVTSGSGAARYDIETVIGRRYPGMPIILYPVQVQGSGAAEAICRAVAAMQTEPVDVLIVGRGGGSREDLMVFNQEAVVRALYESRLPVISAVGHEIDTTLVDLVADLRAPTPSAAAELAVPLRESLAAWHQTLWARARNAVERRLRWERDRLGGWTGHGILAHPEGMVRDHRHQLDRLEERSDRALERVMTQTRHRLERVVTQLAALNPEAPLVRGYAYVTSAEGRLVSAADIIGGERYRVHWYNGAKWMTPVADERGENADGRDQGA
ncbi:MAG: exodeoxyribonuclease VII large subunit [Thermaerobacter sp.]|nr:exodeoxyribonuclease VII large subunit [Thermaerobacter sp.]